MAEKKSSQAQQNGTMKHAVQEQVDRMESFYEQAAEMEEKGMEQVRVGIEESARLMKEAITWQGQLVTEWRRLTLEATRRTADSLGARS